MPLHDKSSCHQSPLVVVHIFEQELAQGLQPDPGRVLCQILYLGADGRYDLRPREDIFYRDPAVGLHIDAALFIYRQDLAADADGIVGTLLEFFRQGRLVRAILEYDEDNALSCLHFFYIQLIQQFIFKVKFHIRQNDCIVNRYDHHVSTSGISEIFRYLLFYSPYNRLIRQDNYTMFC